MKGSNATISEEGTVITRFKGMDQCICVSNDILQPIILDFNNRSLFFKGFVIEILKVISRWSYGIEYGFTNINIAKQNPSIIQKLTMRRLLFTFNFFFFLILRKCVL